MQSHSQKLGRGLQSANRLSKSSGRRQGQKTYKKTHWEESKNGVQDKPAKNQGKQVSIMYILCTHTGRTVR